MNTEKQLDDLNVIRKMMEESSRFLTLSGLSGIFAGIYAIIGAAVAYFWILQNGQIKLDYSAAYMVSGTNSSYLIYLVLDAIAILVLALSTGWYFSYKKAKNLGKPFWNKTAQRLLVQLFIPLLAGAFFILAMVIHNHTNFVASSMLIFYGLSLINGAKYTYGEIHSLGLLQLGLGIVSLFFLNYSLLFFVLGFGFLHIIYGTVMWRKYQ